MKSLIVPLLVSIVVVGMMFGGCAPAATTPEATTPAATTPAATTPEAALKVSETAQWETRFHLDGYPLCDPDLLMNPFGEDFAIKPDGTPYRFAVMHVWMGDDWAVESRGVMKSLIERAGGIYNGVDCEFDIDLQTAQIRDAVSLGTADAIIVQPAQEDAMGPACKEAMDAGIPVFVWCIELYDNDAYTATFQRSWDGELAIGSDAAGQFLAEYADRTGKEIHLLELWGLRTMDSAVKRHNGLHKAIDGNPLITVLESADTGWANETCSEMTAELFMANPELNAVFCPGGGDAGMMEGLAQIGRLVPIGDPEHVIVATHGDNRRTYEGLVNNEVDMIVGSSPWQLVDPLIKSAFRYVVLGQDVQHMNYYDCPTITNENWMEQFQFGGTSLFPLLPLDDFSGYPVLDTSSVGIVAPTLAERMELMGY
jgi:ABC-type sugar transport system substrate-binding protein